MTQVVLVVAFGEPSTTDRDAVVAYLENIFYQNADLEAADTDADRRERAAELARRRAPGIIEEYERIGGSPLNRQAEHRASELETVLSDRGYDVETAVAFQFVEPTIETRIEELAAASLDRLITLPLYPLCGPSTTVAALERVDEAIGETDVHVGDVSHVAGWHRHPRYLRARTDAIRRTADRANADLGTGAATLVFSAHGTPMHYVHEGSRYVQYVEEYCEAIAAMVDVESYALGYQNHENRGIEWTRPAVESVIETLDSEQVVVDPASFLHEQSETLAELDIDLAADATERDIEFHRVPAPHDDPRITDVCADLTEPFLGGFDPGMAQLRQCACHPTEGTRCLNAPR